MLYDSSFNQHCYIHWTDWNPHFPNYNYIDNCTRRKNDIFHLIAELSECYENIETNKKQAKKMENKIEEKHEEAKPSRENETEGGACTYWVTEDECVW